MSGVRVSPDIQLGPRASSISYSALVSQSISRASDTNLSVNLSGSNSSLPSFSLNLGPLTVSGLVSPKEQAIDLSPRFNSHSVVSDPQPDINPFDTPTKPQGQQAHHNMQDRGGGSPEEEMEPIFTPFPYL